MSMVLYKRKYKNENCQTCGGDFIIFPVFNNETRKLMVGFLECKECGQQKIVPECDYISFIEKFGE